MADLAGTLKQARKTPPGILGTIWLHSQLKMKILLFEKQNVADKFSFACVVNFRK